MRVFAIVLGLGVIAAVIGVGWLGAFPPAAHPKLVEHVLPNSSFPSHS